VLPDNGVGFVEHGGRAHGPDPSIPLPVNVALFGHVSRRLGCRLGR